MAAVDLCSVEVPVQIKRYTKSIDIINRTHTIFIHKAIKWTKLFIPGTDCVPLRRNQ